MFRFLSLPREIRDQIYRLVLNTISVINPHPTKDESIIQGSGSLPSTALLAVSKQVRAEARPLFYRENTWQLATEPARNTFTTVEPWFFQDICLRLRGDDTSDLDRMCIGYKYHSSPDDKLFGTNSTYTDDEKRAARMVLVHDECLEKVCTAWTAKVNMLLEDLTHAAFIMVDFSELYCPSGCCRLDMFAEEPIRRLLEALRSEESSFIHGRPEVYFFGIQAEAERMLLLEVYGFSKEAIYARPRKVGFKGQESIDQQEETEENAANEEAESKAIRQVSDTESEKFGLLEEDAAKSQDSDSAHPGDGYGGPTYNYDVLLREAGRKKKQKKKKRYDQG